MKQGGEKILNLWNLGAASKQIGASRFNHAYFSQARVTRVLRYSLVQLVGRRIVSVNANGQFREIKLNEQRDEFKLSTKIINSQVLSDKLNAGSK